MTMTSEPVQSALWRRRDDVVWLLSQLAAVPSEAGSSGESAQRIVGEYLSSAGYEVRYTIDDPAAHADHAEYTAPPPGEPPVNLIAIPRSMSAPRLGLLAHVDTERAGAGWTGEPLRAICKNGRLYALGAADNKSGLAAAAVAAVALSEASRPAPVVMSVHAKGGGARGTLPAMLQAPALSAVLYVHPSETGRGLTEIKYVSRGVLDFVVSVTGWHGPCQEIGTPESARFSEGGDALAALLHVLGRLRTAPLADCEMNVGSVSAGERTGVVPIRAAAAIRALFGAPNTGASVLRKVDAELRRCAQELSSEKGSFGVERSSVDFMANAGSSDWDGPFCRIVRDAVREITGVEPAPYGGHLASDLRFPTRLRGIPAAGVGCRAGGFYGSDEWVDIDDLSRLIATVAKVAQSWSGLEES